MKPLRRYVDADNSCLFASVGYNIDNVFTELTSLQYRQCIVQYLEQNELDVNLFETSKEDYIKLIENTSTWGGAVELKLFSDIFQTQIASIDVQTNRVDIFGEDKNYPQRIYLLYNGIHYDPLVMTNNQNDEIKIFAYDDHETLFAMQNYCKLFKDINDYVDVKNINTMKCLDCNLLFESQDDALLHGTNYNHWNFEEL